VGKTCAVLSLARWVEMCVNPEATFYLIDSENKVRSAMKAFGGDAPGNVVYYKVDTMNQATWAVDDILRKHKPGDWLGVESMSRLWERAQDLAYLATSQLDKAEYLEKRAREGKKAPPIPSPDSFWSVAKGAHDGAFLDRLALVEDLNVVLTSTLQKPPKEGGFMKENVDRKAVRVEMGIDLGIDGAPRLPYYVETLAMLTLKAGQVSCQVLRDNLSGKDETRVEFEVPDRKSWAGEFWGRCR